MPMNMPIIIKNFPMPPRFYKMYKETPMGKVKTSVYEAYEADVKYWLFKNAYQLQYAREVVQRMSSKEAFHVERTFSFLRHRILNGSTPLRNTFMERVPALDEMLADVLGIDEALFWEGDCRKRPTHHVALGEYVDIKLTVVNLDFPEADLDT